MAAQDYDQSVNALLDLINGHRVTAVISVAAKLGIPDLLAERKRTATELAKLTDTHEHSLHRLMRALVTLGICTEGRDGKFDLTKMGRYLSRNADPSLKAWALTEGGMLRAGWSNLIESIRTGKTVPELAGQGQERFEKMAEMGVAGLFNQAMVSMTRAVLPGLLSAYDFSGIATLMDVGGGLGQLLIAILRKSPSMRGIVFDLPNCAEGARKNFADAGLSDRAEFMGGNFFESIPSGVADAIVMKSVLHDWNDERCVRILNNCRRALRPRALLIGIDRILPEKLEPNAHDRYLSLSDLNMLVGPGGCERTQSEYRELLAKGGFQMTRCFPVDRIDVIEATAT